MASLISPHPLMLPLWLLRGLLRNLHHRALHAPLLRAALRPPRPLPPLPPRAEVVRPAWTPCVCRWAALGRLRTIIVFGPLRPAVPTWSRARVRCLRVARCRPLPSSRLFQSPHRSLSILNCKRAKLKGCRLAFCIALILHWSLGAYSIASVPSSKLQNSRFLCAHSALVFGAYSIASVPSSKLRLAYCFVLNLLVFRACSIARVPC